jgi:decaprenylphospho-beta-D-erythro-pentofuranosid-2-ulose 2-reductase
VVTNALGQPDRLLLVGGTSQIAVAIAERLLRDRPLAVVVAARPSARRHTVAQRLRALGATVELVDFEAAEVEQQAKALGAVFDAGDVDVAVVAHGELGDQARLLQDPVAAARLCQTNYASAVSVGVVLAEQMGAQRHGVIVALSSLAAVRARPANFVYGSTKAGLDAFYTGLREQLRPAGVRVLVVRPGLVRTRMTAHLPPTPLATTAQDVAARVVPALPAGNGTVWAPAAMRPVAALLRVLPDGLLRRVPG